MFCPNCGTKLNGANFCPFCGRPVTQGGKRGNSAYSPDGRKKLIAMIAVAAAAVAAVAVVLILIGKIGDGKKSSDNNNAGGLFSSIFDGPEKKQPEGPVAEPIDPGQFHKAPSNGVQDLRFWKGGEYCRSSAVKQDGYLVYEYGSSLDGDTVEAYVEMLQQNGFTLVERFYESYYTNSYLSYGLVCDALPNAAAHGQLFTDNQVHVSITKDRYSDWTFNISEDLKYCDMGIRQSGRNVPIIPRGDSAGAGLNRLGDGSYQTSDGRLSTQVGSAAVTRDGIQNTADAFLKLENGRCILTIDGYAKDEELVLDYEEGTLSTGGIFQINELTDGEPSLSMTIDGERINIDPKKGSEFHSVTLRVMHYEESKDAVLYFYIESQSSTPAVMEVLCAFSTMPYVEPPQTRPAKVDETYRTEEDASYTLRKGDTILVDIGSLESYHFGSDYHTYKWEVVTGGDFIDIYGVGGNCYITATASGTAVITVLYGYTEEGNNVLTGNPEPQHRTTERTFTIIVK